MQKRTTFFKLFIVCFLILSPGCKNPYHSSGHDSTFTFGVLDVGQGLAQIGRIRTEAIIWDFGPQAGISGFLDGYRKLGSPVIHSTILSHSDNDHRGGLALLPDSISYSGVVVVSPYEDTALIREEAGHWKNDIVFRTIVQGDTIGGLSGVYIECLWPPATIVEPYPFEESRLKNRYSLCFMVSHENCRSIITSDIDTFATARLSRNYGYALAADIIVVPHHGSNSAVDPVFYGYVNPQRALISCEIPPNNYGHPSQETIDLLFQMDVSVVATYDEGHVVGRSNGEYWQWENPD
ncbi:MAG: hypothetical protein GF401_16980 [Chitinivibrionales bacterium]|nr:hypothetical protein [Chitinivibrionales bacterium]